MLQVTTIVLNDGYDGQVYRIDTTDPDMARAWLFATVADLRDRHRPGIYCPLTIQTFAVREERA